MQPIATQKIENQYEVALWQRANGKFVVTYGLETKDQLTYAQAATAFGRAVMHAATCAGFIVDSK